MRDDRSFIFSVDHNTIHKPAYKLDHAHHKHKGTLLKMGGTDIFIKYECDALIGCSNSSAFSNGTF
jgi:hypothetical protein